jgi:uncharacterized RDD family membrane protein YckC
MICRDLTIRRRDGGEVSFVWYFLRVLVGIVLIPLVPLSFIVALTVRDGERTLADRVMGTTVCRGDGIKSQNVVSPEFRGVSLIARFGAFMLDTLVAAFWLIVAPGPGIIFFRSIWFTLVLAYLPGAVIGAFLGGTFGMWALGLQFYDKDGSEISLVACVLRNVMDILLIPVMPISLLAAGMNRRRQTPADWLFETVVGRKKEWRRESLPRID